MRFLVVSVLLLAAVPAAAVEPMIGAELGWSRISIGGENFNPLTARARLALGLNPDWEIGVVAGGGIRDDEAVNVTVAIDTQQAAYLRYSASLDDNARLVLTLGYGETTLDVQTVFPGFPGSETYSGLVYGLSLQERLSRWPNWIGSLDLERWYDKDGLGISTVSYGFRYAF